MIKGILFGIGLAIGLLGVAGGLMALGAYGLAQDAKTLETSFESRAMEAFDKTMNEAAQAHESQDRDCAAFLNSPSFAECAASLPETPFSRCMDYATERMTFDAALIKCQPFDEE